MWSLYQYIANASSGAFGAGFPKVLRDYEAMLAPSMAKLGVTRAFEKSPEPAYTLNCPNAVCRYHKDHKNRALGACLVCCGGKFNPTTGGHFVLPELKLAIEFPPGSILAFPSAVLAHGNLPVKSGERRFSFTQYAAGGWFHWVEFNHQTSDKLKETNPTLHGILTSKKHRTEAGPKQLMYLSRIENLREDRRVYGARALRGKSAFGQPLRFAIKSVCLRRSTFPSCDG